VILQQNITPLFSQATSPRASFVVILYSKKHHYLYSTSRHPLDKVILPVFLIMVAIFVTFVSYIINSALAQSNFTSSAPSYGSTTQTTPSPRPPNVLRPPAANNQTPAANNQTPAANNQTPAAPAITAPPRPTIIAPSNFTASTITSEIEAGNTTTPRSSSRTNGSMFLGVPP
jgi:cytoskeletal protein RodZ